MRLFVTLCSVLALAQAKPQGYNYGSGVSGTLSQSSGSFGGSGFNAGFQTAPSNTQNVASYGPLGAFQGASVGSLLSSSHGQGQATNYGGSSSGSSSFGGLTGSYNGGRTSGFGGSSSQGFGNSASSNFAGFGATPNIGFGGLAGYQAPNYQQQEEQEQRVGFEAPLVHKQFITVAAPDEHENLERTKHLVIGRPQKNYRVVFIKAPSSSNANVKLSAEYAPKEEKTVIYVLSKKDSSLEVNDIATPAPTIPSKPEVFFIKYKTDAEAQHAQQQIQAEYDRIEGTSEHTDGGVAPAQSVVGILDAGNGAGSSSNSIANSGAASQQQFTHQINAGSTGSSHAILGGNTVSTHKNAQTATYLPPSH